MKLWKKIVLSASIALGCLVLILGISVFALWHNELSSISSIEVLVEEKSENHSGPVYLMDVKGGYYFDDFIAQGGASNDDELISFLLKNITKGIIPIDIKAPTIGCASFTCQDEGGKRYFGRNYDLEKTTTMIVRTNPKDGRYASISTVDLKFLGIKRGAYLSSVMEKFLTLASAYIPLDGINEKGLACGVYMTLQGTNATGSAVGTDQQTDRPDLTSTTMLRLILDYAATVDEAVELVSKYDLHDSANTSFHYMIADATGKSAILEWVCPTDMTDTDGSKRVLKVTYNDDDTHIGALEAADNFQYVTNFIIQDGYYEADENKRGYDRYLRIQEMINPDGTNPEGVVKSTKEMLDILKEVGRRSWKIVDGKYDPSLITVHSALYNLTDKYVTWVSNEEFDNEDAIFIFDFSYIK